ncbi:bifunctional DNA primase/polymerase [Cyanobium sp. CH-040]|uniref:bifunctional DNA primase/polymerase n=1 Tax=Cyanobium sp. CH-040 TaxID=2823708 RepID=UPI0020CC2F50|nr:bifunctional DNA primase/polymerase [Cyanobium sp. CH-040]MCP9928590.1 bifunctional DNA primase/polymerase [Cyanobium sp. CH-040]
MTEPGNDTSSESEEHNSSLFEGERVFDLWKRGVFPSHWAIIPVAGKDTYVSGWQNEALSEKQCESEYRAKSAYRGLGVVTGRLSHGLVAIDIDGPEADARLKAVLGDAYEPLGEETTMSWTSGKPGRRQILYRLPEFLYKELDHVNKLVLRLDGTWGLEQDDLQTRKAAENDYEEVVIRFNKCQSVLPNSPHPDTKKPYRFLNYNGGKPAEAPAWLCDVMGSFREPVEFLSEEDLRDLTDEVGETLLPPPQIRGWFFKKDGPVQNALIPRLEDLIFKHPNFKRWKPRGGSRPQMMNYCPWHGGSSGTAFQFNPENGCWDCKACGVGGDVLDFVHKVETGDMAVGKPTGPALEKYVQRIVTELGFHYPDDALPVQKTTEVPKVTMGADEFLEQLLKIYKDNKNPAVQLDKMALLALETGRRMSGFQCMEALNEYRYFKKSEEANNAEWWEGVQRLNPVIPDLLVKPSQVILHAAGGLGKTSTCLALVRAILNRKTMKVRGLDVEAAEGNVLWISNDQSVGKLLQDCEDNDIDYKSHRFIVKSYFQLNHVQKMREWILKYKPILVVVDSLGSASTRMQAEEHKKAFAMPLYEYAAMNGSNDEDGFPATCFLWIHHDNAQGELRGTRYLAAAVDETWHLRKPTDEELESLRERGRKAEACRMIQIGKSRLGREGDLLVSERNVDFEFTLDDYTPTQRRENNGQGDPDPYTMVLKVLKDRTEDPENDPMTVAEIYDEIKSMCIGLGLKVPSDRSVRNWVGRWVKKGLVKEGKKRVSGEKGRPAPTYRVNSSSPLYMHDYEGIFSENTPNQLGEKGSDFRNDPNFGKADLSENAPDSENPEDVPSVSGGTPETGQAFSERAAETSETWESFRKSDPTPRNGSQAISEKGAVEAHIGGSGPENGEFYPDGVTPVWTPGGAPMTEDQFMWEFFYDDMLRDLEAERRAETKNGEALTQSSCG